MNEYKPQHIFAVGIRLSASFLLKSVLVNKLSGLILWHPIINGKQYISQIKKRHNKWLNGSYARKRLFHTKFEYLGFEIPRKLKKDLKTLDFYNSFNDCQVTKLIIDNPSEKIDFAKLKSINADVKQFSIINQKDFNFWIKQNNNALKTLIPENEIKIILTWLQSLNV